MALALKDRVKETTIVVGTGTATLLGSSIGFQPFSVVGNGNTTYYCISDQFGSNWEVGIGTYSSSGNTLARTTVLASSNGGALVVFTSGVKDVFVTYPAEKGVWLDASNNAIGLGTPAAFVGTNITGTASGLTAGNVTTNANLSGAVSSIGNSTSLGSFTSAQLALAISDETGTGKAVFATNPTLTSPTYAGTLTGSTDILNIGSGQIYKDASGNVGIGTSSPYNATTDVLTVTRNQNAITQLLIDNQNVGASSQTRLALEASGNGWYIANQKTGNPLTFSNNSGEKMRIDASGRLLIAATSLINNVDTAPLQVSGGAVTPIALRGGTNGYQIAFYNSAGTAVIGSVTGATGSTTAYNTASDQRLKENIVDAPSALVSVNAIKVRSFDWKTDGTHVDYGYIAQELLEVAPEAVTVPEDEDQMMGVDFGKLTPRLVKAIQELKSIIDTQQEQINSLLGK